LHGVLPKVGAAQSESETAAADAARRGRSVGRLTCRIDGRVRLVGLELARVLWVDRQCGRRLGALIRIESAFNRLKDFKRIATRYDKLARNYSASVCLVAALVWWI
jgi:transposase